MYPDVVVVQDEQPQEVGDVAWVATPAREVLVKDHDSVFERFQ
jgi:hypothetical protein